MKDKKIILKKNITKEQMEDLYFNIYYNEPEEQLTDIQKRNRINYIKENKERINIKNGKKIQDKFLNNKDNDSFVEFGE